MSKFKQWLDKKLNEDGAMPMPPPPTYTMASASSRQRGNPISTPPDDDGEYTQLANQIQTYVNRLKTALGRIKNKQKAMEVLDQVASAVLSVPGMNQTIAKRVMKQAGTPQTGPPAGADAGMTPGI